MATIAILPFQFAGNVNTSFAVARALRARGHRVTYLAPPGLAAKIRRQGFEYREFLGDVFPEAPEADPATAPSLEDQRRERAALLGALRGGAIEQAQGDLGPDLYLTASCMPELGLAAFRTGKPVVTYSSNLLSVADPIVPPLVYHLVPGKTFLYGPRVRYLWRQNRKQKDQLIAAGAWTMEEETRELARWAGFPLERIEVDTESWPRLGLPELILCPREFDFPRARVVPDCHFVEPGIDVAREDAQAGWSLPDDDRPLVYAAAGMLASSMHGNLAHEFHQRFLDAVALRPGWRGLAAIGTGLDPSTLRIPPNATVIPVAPQLEVLRRARLMVSHAGMNSVREAIHAGVPLTVLPLFFDQAGCAARVAYHGLGTRERLWKCPPETLARSMERAMTDPGIRARVARMSEIFVRAQRETPSVGVIEACLAAGRQKVASEGR